MLSLKHNYLDNFYVVAYSFTYTQWYQQNNDLRNVPIIRYLHLSTTTHTLFWSLDCMDAL